MTTAEYIKLTVPVAASLARSTPAPTRPAPPDNGISSNAGGAPLGRAILLLVDQGNIRFGSARPVMQNALKFVDRLQPNDRLALVAVPGPVSSWTSRPITPRCARRCSGSPGV